MKIMKNIILAAGVAFLVSASTPVFAATAPDSATPLSYGFVDLGRIMKEATVASNANAELVARKKSIESEFDKKAQALQHEGEGLMKQKASMQPADFEKKMKDLSTRITSAREDFEKRKHDFSVSMKSTVDSIQAQAGDVVQTVASEKGYAAVFTRDAVFIGARNLDITDEVIKRMNASPKKIDTSAKK